ncbi:MAG: flippase [Clostridia bacterium]|nr:flippase [Clostridia bacterium]
MNLKALIKSKEIQNAGWLIGGRVVQMGLSLIVGILTARYLGPSNYGLISYGSAYVSFFSALCTLGLNSVIIKDFVDNPEEQGEAIGSALLMRFVSSVMSAFMIVGFVAVFDSGEPLTIAVVALCSIGSIFHIFEIFNYWFQYQYKSRVTAVAALVAYVVTSAYKIILLVAEKSVCWFALATSVDYIVLAIFLLAAYKKHDGKKLKFSRAKSRSLFNVSRHYLLSAIMVSIYGQTDKLMLKHMAGETEVGYYAIAMTICSIWTFVLQAIIDSIYPTILCLKDENYSKYEKKNRQLYAIVFYISIFVSLFFLLFGELVVNILYGAEYMSSVKVLRIVTWYTAFSFLGVARNAWIVSEGHQKYLKYMYVCAAILNIILNLVFIPYIGGVGAALASLITQIFSSIILPLLFKSMRPNVKLIIDAILLKGIK